MSSSDLDVIAAVSMWLVVCYRIPLARQAGSSRALWCALLFLAIGQTLKILSVNDAVEQQLGAPGAAVALRHYAAVGSAAGVLVEVSYLRNARDTLGRRALLLTVPTVLAMLAPFVYSPGPPDPALTGHAEWYAASAVSVIHWLAYLTYLGWALFTGAVLCWRNRAHAAASPMRTGITLIGAGMVLGLTYVALKLWMTFAWVVGNGPSLLAFDHIAETVILAVVLLLICAGCAWQPAAIQLDSLQEAARTIVALWRLHPLWTVLQEAAPRIVLEPDQPVRRYNLATPTQLARLLVDRVIEIRDGLIDVATFAGPRVRGDALRAALAAGLEEAPAQAAAEAVTLEVGLRNKASGGRSQHIDAVVPGAQALPADSAWLIQVARAYATPLTPALADLLTKVSDHVPVA